MMNLDKSNKMIERISFEEAINKAGFGLYSYLMTSIIGICIISFACIGYGSTFIVPTSACELETTVSQQGILAAGPVVGLILGAFCWGYLADTRGRRLMLLVCLIGGVVFNLVATISVNWIMLLIFQFLASLFASGLYSIGMSLLSESVPASKKNLVVLTVSSISLVSQGLMAILARPIIPLSFSFYLSAIGIYWNSWRLLMVVFAGPSLISIIGVYFLQESPKFVFSKGNEEEALRILRIIHRVNNWRSKEELEVQGLLMAETEATSKKMSAMEQIAPLFKAPYLKYTIIMTVLYVSKQVGAFLVWLPTIADQFVRIIQDGEGTDLTMCGILNMEPTPADPNATPCALDETSLLMVFGIGVFQSICNIFMSLSIGFVGRRNMAIVMAALCGVAGILVNLVPNVIGSAVLFVVFLQSIIMVGLYTALMVSLFPTHLRTMAIAFALTCARMATFASIQILNVMLATNCDAGFYLFACILASSAIITFFLPDDRKSQPAALSNKKADSGYDTPPKMDQMNDGHYKNLAD